MLKLKGTFSKNPRIYPFMEGVVQAEGIDLEVDTEEHGDTFAWLLDGGASDVFEFSVALMLVGLGARAIYRAAQQGIDGPSYLHHHGRLVHAHPGAPAHVHIGRWTLARRPLLVGAVHGLAGSGALTALVLATLPSTAAQLVYMALFGLGSTLGMAGLSGIVGWPLGRIARHPSLERAVSMAVGCISIVLGVCWGYPLVGRLF